VEDEIEEELDMGDMEETNPAQDAKLQDVPGLGPKSAEQLTKGGITTPAALMAASLSDIEEMGLTRSVAKRLREAIVGLYPDLYSDFREEKSLEDIEGIGPTTAKALREKGMNIKLLETTPVKELEESYGLTSNTAIKYQNAIADAQGGYFTNGLDFMLRQKMAPSFTFGADSLDRVFTIAETDTKGVKAGETYEFFGSFRSGKSQICHQLCVTVQMPPEMGGLGKKAVYIDTEGTFSPSRITQMANRLKAETGWEKSVEDILKDIMYARAKNSDMQIGIAHKLKEVLGEAGSEFGLLIVDSVSSHFRAEYAGRGTLAERQQTLNNHLSILHRIADTYDLAVVVTNQVQANPAQFFGDPTTAVGGNIMGHWATHRMYLRKSKGEKRVLKVYDSPVIGEIEAVFEITEDGILTSEA
jgi:DNA repair protein RadA